MPIEVTALPHLLDRTLPQLLLCVPFLGDHRGPPSCLAPLSKSLRATGTRAAGPSFGRTVGRTVLACRDDLPRRARRAGTADRRGRDPDAARGARAGARHLQVEMRRLGRVRVWHDGWCVDAHARVAAEASGLARGRLLLASDVWPRPRTTVERRRLGG